MNLQEVLTSDGVISGPPCPPFSRKGKRGRWCDDRVHVFWKILECIVDQANRPGGLKFFLIENVDGMQMKAGKESSPLDDVLSWLREKLQGWYIVSCSADPRLHGVPQTRPRIYIHGFLVSSQLNRHLKFDFFEISHPERDPPSLYQMLEKGLRYEVPRTPKQFKTLLDAKRQLQPMLMNEAFGGKAVVIDVNRAMTASWGLSISKLDTAPCITTNNTGLYVLALGEGYGGVEDTVSIERFLTEKERAQLQGFPHDLGLKASRQRVAIGNAMTVQVVGAHLAFLLHGLDVD